MSSTFFILCRLTDDVKLIPSVSLHSSRSQTGGYDSDSTTSGGAVENVGALRYNSTGSGVEFDSEDPII